MDVRSPDLISTSDDLVPPFETASGEDQAFVAYYEKEVRPLMTTLEIYRADALAEHKKRKPRAIAIVVLAVVGAFWVASMVGEGDIPFFIAVICCVAAYGWMSEPLRKFETLRQNEILPKVVRFFGDFTYQRHSTLTESEVKLTKIVPTGNRFTAGDEIKGEHGGTTIRFSEARTVMQHRKSSTVLFNGLFVAIEFGKPFHGITLVKKEAGQWRKTGLAGELETVDLEDPVFEGKFEVYSDDQVEARYLLTPDFMVRLLDLVEARGGKTFQCAFIARSLYIAIPTTKNMFELGAADRHSDDPEAVRRVYREIKDILSIIDILRIDRQTPA